MGLSRPIPKVTRDRIAQDPFYKTCARTDDPANHWGRITIEHSLIYAGRRIDDYFNLIPLCWYHHLDRGLNKARNQWIALSRATIYDLEKYPSFNQMQSGLMNRFGGIWRESL